MAEEKGERRKQSESADQRTPSTHAADATGTAIPMWAFQPQQRLQYHLNYPEHGLHSLPRLKDAYYYISFYDDQR